MVYIQRIQYIANDDVELYEGTVEIYEVYIDSKESNKHPIRKTMNYNKSQGDKAAILGSYNVDSKLLDTLILIKLINKYVYNISKNTVIPTDKIWFTNH